MDDEKDDYYDCGKKTKMELYSYAGGLLGAALVYMLCFSHATLMLEKLGLRMRNALMAAVYRKCLRLNNGARNAISTGKIVTLMSNDCQTIERFITQVTRRKACIYASSCLQ
jgi:ABC-type bacteriocin/lantibiotic exporter with double-glycine peptidase domain